MRWLRSKRKPLVGLDIGSSAIKVAELKGTNGKDYELEALGIEGIPPGAIVDGLVVSKPPVVDAINRLFLSHHIRNSRIATSISGHSVIVKSVTLPAQNEKELEQAIQWEAEQYIPFDISDVNLDYEVLRSIPEENKIEVILVAARRDKITGQTDAVRAAGKTPMVVDVDAFALQNAYEINYQPEADKVAALLNVGCATMNISILRGSEFLFTRDMSMGGNHYTDFLQRDLAISSEEAEKYKRGEAPSEELKWKTRSILESVTEILALEVQKTFDYFRTTTTSHEIHEIYLSGGASRTEGLLEYLGERFQLPVTVFNPFNRIRVREHRFAPGLLENQASDFVIAVGLALRSTGDARKDVS